MGVVRVVRRENAHHNKDCTEFILSVPSKVLSEIL